MNKRTNIRRSKVEAQLGNTNTNCASNQRSRGWSWTLNNYTEEEYNDIISKSQRYFSKWIVGKEIGSNKKTPHLQGYFYSDTQITFNTIKSIIPKAHIEKSKGTPNQNYKYCSKEGNFMSKGFDKKRKLTAEEHYLMPLEIELQDYLEDEAISWYKNENIVDNEPYIE